MSPSPEGIHTRPSGDLATGSVSGWRLVRAAAVFSCLKGGLILGTLPRRVVLRPTDTMNQSMTECYRQWLREQLQTRLNTPADTHQAEVLYLPLRELEQITIEELYFHLMRCGIRAPQRTTASILAISRETVRTALRSLRALC